MRILFDFKLHKVLLPLNVPDEQIEVNDTGLWFVGLCLSPFSYIGVTSAERSLHIIHVPGCCILKSMFRGHNNFLHAHSRALSC